MTTLNSEAHALGKATALNVSKELSKADKALSKELRKAGAAMAAMRGAIPIDSAFIATLKEFEKGYRESASYKPTKISLHLSTYFLQGFNAALADLQGTNCKIAYWHQNGLSGNGNPASFHLTPAPAKANKKADPVPTRKDATKDPEKKGGNATGKKGPAFKPATVSEVLKLISTMKKADQRKLIQAIVKQDSADKAAAAAKMAAAKADKKLKQKVVA